jgi:acyl-CoA reductase-like NAD-dependent aldehyde dehydrogenase
MLCAINGIIPAILSGNSILVKQSERSSLCADAFEESFKIAGASDKLVQA